MLHRYFLQLSYNGTRYHGWQVQPNAVSVQETIEKALSTLLREPVSVVGAGRTDTGVHASYFILHFDLQKPVAAGYDLVYKLNSYLPNDIAVQKCWPVSGEAHARFSATSRTYHYFITTEKDPFSSETAYRYTLPLDVEKMNEAAQMLFNYEDFTSFSRLHTDVKTNNCKIYQAEWKREGARLVFVVKADRFLRNMVRAIVGTLLEVGKGKLSVAEFCAIIERQDRGAAGASAPAHGLFLVDIEYPEAITHSKM
ncbi:tRNA pseudouridine(38-40) synthase TruA [Maribellus sp. CM-23]|uniref:tRNA pseudouridine(38-40) synthase TruA n=1 Tax=Maribellus sp. CM-23 TaxID=2781026 RepID=UPI001F4265AD|nr:tRNA pseudouridine(38-40) synthase TruA [Maribellus sp. CM-23]MCE4565361.1 tRNA pseudouridine(38-40) synthase TruA [Maribellus sp. CM-23]